MKIAEPLFVAEHILLAPIDHEKDAEVESKWSHDPEFARLLGNAPAMPRSAAEIKKVYEKLEKDVEERRNLFYFTIRMRSDERLIGSARLQWIEWSNGSGFLHMGIGDPLDRGHGYGGEALRLLLRFAFAEATLYRLAAVIPEYNTGAQRFFIKAGFVEEARRRQALQRDGRRWDLLHFGMLRREWEAQPGRLA